MTLKQFQFEWFIGFRYLRAKNRQTFIALITFLSIAGVSVGVMTLMTVIAVMTGTEHLLQEKILSVQPHVVLMHHTRQMPNYQSTVDQLLQMDGVKQAIPFIYHQIMFRSAKGICGAMMNAIGQPDKMPTNTFRKFIIEKLYIQTKSNDFLPGILLGSELAIQLNVSKGDSIYMIIPKTSGYQSKIVPQVQQVSVIDIFTSGLYEYDKNFAFVRLDQAQQILDMGDQVTGIEIKLNQIFEAENFANSLMGELGYTYWARDWMRMNRNLFSSLKLQKAVMYIIFSLIVLVAGFSITSSLIMMVIEKTKDIAILKTMGARKKNIRNIFVFNGFMVGSIGTALGILSGLCLCYLLKNYQFVELPKDIYFFTTLPVYLDWVDLLIISSGTILICILSAVYPAHRAASLHPVEGIRAGE
ncbi:lipoprotein releasing system, transmembrane protein, LolC/E family [Candidatus Magnetomorum sp. HK-1]|nr:lipoprotein releasing system, transmembrane protein, LolC/E family [Candidatus Magnetomorum sp. HK-1]